MFMALLTLMAVLLWPNDAQATALGPAFSQVKIRGTTTGDEFIELYNPSEASRNLNGYKLVKQTSGGKTYILLTFGQDSIQPQSFFLLALEGSSFENRADATYKLALADDNALFLYDSDDQAVDTLAWGTGKTLPNHTADESYQRDWQATTQGWGVWHVGAFLSARRNGDVWPEDATSAEPLIPPCAISPAPVPSEPTATTPDAPALPSPAPAQPPTQSPGTVPTETSPILATAGRVIISEVFANPTGDEATDEFIELYNQEAFAVSMAGWTVADASKSKIMEPLSIGANSFLLLRRAESGLTLNNTSETIALLDANQTVMTQFSYSKAAEGLSWNAAVDGTWYEAAPTPNQQNAAQTQVETDATSPIEPLMPSQESVSLDESVPPTVPISSPETDESQAGTSDGMTEPITTEIAAENGYAASSDKAGSRITSAAAPKMAIPEVSFLSWDKVKAKTLLRLTGVVTVLPGVFNGKTAILQDVAASTPGVELYFSKADWPELEVGDVLLITGKKSAAKQGRRLLIGQESDIVILDHVDFEPPMIDAQDLQAKHQNTVVQMQGRLIKEKAGTITLVSGNKEITVTGKKAGIALEWEENSEEGIAVGLYKHKGQPELWLRQEDDFQAWAASQKNAEPIAIVASPEKPVHTITAVPKKDPTAEWFAQFAAISSAGGLTWYFFQEQLRQQGLRVWQKLRR